MLGKTSWYSIDVSGNDRHILLFYKKCNFCHLLPFAEVGQYLDCRSHDLKYFKLMYKLLILLSKAECKKQQQHYDLQNTMIYKILNGHSAITPNNFFEFNKMQTRKKNNLTLRTYQPRGNIYKFAFVQRSIPEWHTLPNVIVQANSTEQFRVFLEKHLQQYPLPSLAF